MACPKLTFGIKNDAMVDAAGDGRNCAMYNGMKHKLGFQINFLNRPAYRGEKTYADVARRVKKEYEIGCEDVLGDKRVQSLRHVAQTDFVTLNAVKGLPSYCKCEILRYARMTYLP